jgi:hypothetical protein
MTINIFAFTADQGEFKTGYQNHAINFAKAFEQVSRSICFMPLRIPLLLPFTSWDIQLAHL